MHRMSAGYLSGMGLMRKAMAVGVAKKLYDESRKPQNQQRIQDAVASVKARRAGGQGRPGSANR